MAWETVTSVTGSILGAGGLKNAKRFRPPKFGETMSSGPVDLKNNPNRSGAP
jgi:hypothetical protein